MNIIDSRFDPYTNPATMRALLGPEAGPENFGADIDSETGSANSISDGSDAAITEAELQRVFGVSSGELAVSGLTRYLRPETSPEAQ